MVTSVSNNWWLQQFQTIIWGFQVRHPRCVDRITIIGKMQSNTTFIAKMFFLHSLS